MAIIINIDVMLAKRKMSVTELADKVGITMANISILKNGKARAIRLSTLEAICKALECQPGDLLEYKMEMEPAAEAAIVAERRRPAGNEAAMK
jgi:putative transcriptional regulator